MILGKRTVKKGVSVPLGFTIAERSTVINRVGSSMSQLFNLTANVAWGRFSKSTFVSKIVQVLASKVVTTFSLSSTGQTVGNRFVFASNFNTDTNTSDGVLLDLKRYNAELVFKNVIVNSQDNLFLFKTIDCLMVGINQTLQPEGVVLAMGFRFVKDGVAGRKIMPLVIVSDGEGDESVLDVVQSSFITLNFNGVNKVWNDFDYNVPYDLKIIFYETKGNGAIEPNSDIPYAFTMCVNDIPIYDTSKVFNDNIKFGYSFLSSINGNNQIGFDVSIGGVEMFN